MIEVATTGDDLWGEDMINVVGRAYETVTGNPLPDNATTGAYPDLDPLWDFDFDDDIEIRRRLPRLADLFLRDEA